MRADAIPLVGAKSVEVETVATVPAREEVDRLLLPPLRERARDSLWFLAIAQSIYAITLLFSQGPSFELRAGLNAIRLGVLFASVHVLRGEGSRRNTLSITIGALAVQFAIGVAISVVRADAFPMILLVLALTSLSSVLIPWGALAQGAVSATAGLSLLVASTIVDHTTGVRHIGFDAGATMATLLALTTYIAHFLDASRRSLEQRLAEARASDLELAALRTQLERRVAERTADLEMANRELEGFSYTVSHDLRSPLRTIAGFTQMILDDDDGRLDDAARSNLAKIRQASRRMDGMIDDMLLLARVGRGALRYETVDLAALARTIGEDLANEFPDRRVELSVEAVPVVQGDHALLRIALDNLLRNAWKFTATREVAHVSVAGERNKAGIVCRITDDGIGFDPRFRPKLFHPFERIHGDSRFPGTGVGLATVARIVRRHGGDVDAHGWLGEGSTFEITLPLRRGT
ncbi:MAG TPA: ATP-binding protein [Candidatus Binatia bacterium]